MKSYKKKVEYTLPPSAKELGITTQDNLEESL